MAEQDQSAVAEDFIDDAQAEVLLESGDESVVEKRKRVPRGVVSGYNYETYEPHIAIDRWGSGPNEVSVVYPDNSVVKSNGSNCYRIKRYLGKGVHAVEFVGHEYIGTQKYPPETLSPDQIWGLADNSCALVVLGKEVIFTDKFDDYKKVIDDLLGELPEVNIQQFSQDPFFARYQSVMMDGKTLPYKERKEFVKHVDDLLGQLPDDIIQRFVVSKNYRLYTDVTDHYSIGGE